MRYSPDMNWKILIAEIQEYGGLTQAEVGEKCGTTQSTISSLANRSGGEPSFSLGSKLKELHKKLARKQPAKVV
jgi:transcriptional regulator with XRE-family HTH domain